MAAADATDVRAAAERIFNEGDVDHVDDLYVEDMVMHHVPTGEEYAGRDAFKGWIEGLRTAYPDFHVEHDDVIVGDEKFVTQYTVSGTHEGQIPGYDIEPTHASMEIRGVTVHRVVDETLVEAWWYYDNLTLLGQLGVLPESLQ